MNKFFLCFCTLLALNLPAQQTAFSQSFSVVTGPNMYYPLYENSAEQFALRPGWSAGGDYMVQAYKRIALKIGLHYHGLQFKEEYRYSGFGTAHNVHLEIYHALIGLRCYFNRPNPWRWYVDGEVGASIDAKLQAVDTEQYIHWTPGFITGLQWQPAERSWGMFIQPAIRYVQPQYQVKQNDPLSEEVGADALLMSLEIGLRLQFSQK